MIMAGQQCVYMLYSTNLVWKLRAPVEHVRDPFSSDPNTLDKNEFTCFCYGISKRLIIVTGISPAPLIHYGPCVRDLWLLD